MTFLEVNTHKLRFLNTVNLSLSFVFTTFIKPKLKHLTLIVQRRTDLFTSVNNAAICTHDDPYPQQGSV